jgi:hypothetical protein
MAGAWIPWKYAVAFAVVYFSVRQIASDAVAVGLALASFPLVWWVARRVSDQEAEAEFGEKPEGQGLRSRFGKVVSSLNPVGHRPLPPLHDPPDNNEHQ